MKIKLIAVGKIKEKYWCDAINEYLKRLRPMCDFSLIEVNEVNTIDILKNKHDEAINILNKIKDDDYVITLEIKGNEVDSVSFANFIDNHYTFDNRILTFVIGGSDGLHEDVIKRSNKHLSFGAFTYPHQLMRVILIEQIYRSMMIINKKPYHK